MAAPLFRNRCPRQITRGTRSSIPPSSRRTASPARMAGQTEENVGSHKRDTDTRYKKCFISVPIRTFPQTFSCHLALLSLAGTPWERSDFASFNQLVQELISGTIQRHVFTQWELDLLLDLQTCSIRKCARPDVLRRYLKAVQQHFAEDTSSLLRLSAFVEHESHHRTPAQVVSPAADMVGAASRGKKR